jgi:hypothetical protein
MAAVAEWFKAVGEMKARHYNAGGACESGNYPRRRFESCQPPPNFNNDER